MMHRASSLLAFMILALSLVGSGAGSPARAADDAAVRQLCDQLAAYVTLPSLPGDDRDLGPAEHEWLAGDTELAQPPLMAQDQVFAPAIAPEVAPATPPQADKDTGASTPFLMDLPPETETFSMDSDTSYGYEAPAERSREPYNFQISDSLKVKAQPIGGGMGGRVILTYSFTTGY
jgi:hypothetical protein